MPYSVLIQSQSGQALQGVIYIYNSGGQEVGNYIVPAEGTILSPDTVAQGSSFKVISPGYSFMQVSQLYEDGNVFALVPIISKTAVGIIAFTAGFIISKLFKI